MPSCHCNATEEQFDERTARADLTRYRRRGPDPATALVLAAVEHDGVAAGATLLDVGGGVGVIHHHLLEHGFSSAVQVDASSAYLAAAGEEAARLGHGDRVTLMHGGLQFLRDQLATADVVTMNRVVCCDPDYATLLASAADIARQLLVFSFPRDRWFVRAGVALFNGLRRLTNSPFRVYLHPRSAMAAVLVAHGLQPRSTSATWLWTVEAFERGR